MEEEGGAGPEPSPLSPAAAVRAARPRASLIDVDEDEGVSASTAATASRQRRDDASAHPSTSDDGASSDDNSLFERTAADAPEARTSARAASVAARFSSLRSERHCSRRAWASARGRWRRTRDSDDAAAAARVGRKGSTIHAEVRTAAADTSTMRRNVPTLTSPPSPSVSFDDDERRNEEARNPTKGEAKDATSPHAESNNALHRLASSTLRSFDFEALAAFFSAVAARSETALATSTSRSVARAHHSIASAITSGGGRGTVFVGVLFQRREGVVAQGRRCHIILTAATASIVVVGT